MPQNKRSISSYQSETPSLIDYWCRTSPRVVCTKSLFTHVVNPMQDISPSNLMVRVGEYHVLNRNETHPHLDRRIREVISQWRNKVLSKRQRHKMHNPHKMGKLQNQPNMFQIFCFKSLFTNFFNIYKVAVLLNITSYCLFLPKKLKHCCASGKL